MPIFDDLGNNQPYFKNSAKKLNFLSLASKRDIYPNSRAYIKENYGVCWVNARDRQDIRLATKNKKPLKGDWCNRRERRKVHQLLSKYGEWGARTGKKVGNWWDCRADFDFFHDGTSFKVGQHWEKSFKKLSDWLGIKYDKTQKGVHITLLLKELPANCLIYHFDRYGKRRVLGSILSANRHAQGLGSPHKESAGKGKWALKAQNIEEVAKLFEKFFFIIDYEGKLNKSQLKLEKKIVSKGEVVENSKVKENGEGLKKIVAQILQREKLPIRKNKPIYKQWYQEKGKGKQYFLLDTYYQNYGKEILSQLSFGSLRNLILNKGSPHWFFKRLSC